MSVDENGIITLDVGAVKAPEEIVKTKSPQLQQPITPPNKEQQQLNPNYNQDLAALQSIFQKDREQGRRPQYKIDESELKSRQDSDTIGKSLMTAAREVIPGVRELQDGRPVFTSFAFEDNKEFDKTSPEALEIIQELGIEHNNEALNTNSFEELVNMRNQIRSAEKDIKYMSDTHGFTGSMGLYMAASLVDPSSYLGYTLAGKMYNFAKVADKISKMNKAGRAASYAAAPIAIEGASEYYIQSHGAREYESVGATMLFAGTLGGGGSLFTDILKTAKSERTEKAFEALTTGGVTLRSDSKSARENLDALFNEDNLAPYRSKLIDAIPSIFKQFKNSSTFQAWERGGSIAALAHRFDTLPGMSAPKGAVFGKDDDLIYKPDLREGRTAMDVKYEMLENFVQLEYARLQSYKKYSDKAIKDGGVPITKAEYAEASHMQVSELYNTYRSKKLAVIDDIKKEYDVQDDLAAVVDRELEKDIFYKELETDELKVEYRDSMIDAEINNLAAERMKDLPEYKNSASPEYKEMVDALGTYYEATKQAMIKAGMPHARTMDSRFYQPIMYKKDEFINDPKGAEAAIEKAIRESEDFKRSLADAEFNLEKAKREAKKNKKITEEQQKENEIFIQNQDIKLAKLRGIREGIEDVLKDITISPIDKAIYLERLVSMSGDVVTNSLARTFRTKNDVSGKYQLVERYISTSGRTGYKLNGRYWYMEGGEKKIYSEKWYNQQLAKAEPISNVDLVAMQKRYAEGKIYLGYEEARIKVREILKSSPQATELMKLTDTKIEDIIGGGDRAIYDEGGILKGYYERGAYSGTSKEIGGYARDLNEEVLIHELFHNLTVELKSNPKIAKQIDSIKKELNNRYDDFIEIYQKQNPDATIADLDHVRDRFDYMVDYRYDELFSVGLSEPKIAKVLTEMKTGIKIGGKQQSFMDKIFDMIIKSLGFKSMKDVPKDSIFYQSMKIVKNNMKKKKLPAAEKKLRSKYADAERKLRDLTIRMEEVEDELSNIFAIHADEPNPNIIKELSAPANKLKESLQKEIDKAANDSKLAVENLVNYHKKKEKDILNETKAYQNKIIEEAKKTIVEETEAVQAARLALHNTKNKPKLQARSTVEAVTDAKTTEQLGFSDIASTMKKRSLNINTTVPEVRKYMNTNEADMNNIYHYSVSGRSAVQHATGFQNPKDFRRYLEDNSGLNKDEIEIATDMFELTLGTKQIPTDPKSKLESMVRFAKNANYLTMGGQFASYGLSEIGAGVYATGFRYLRHLIPALDTTIKMYSGAELSKVESDLVRLAEAGEIYQHNSTAKYGDYNDISSTFNSSINKGMDKLSRFMFRFSGLEGISTITKTALPLSFLERIIKQAGDGKSHYDLMRWGISAEDMLNVAKAPVIRNERGIIVDFNFDAWEKGLKDRFQLATTRMSRDGILRADAVRIPTWVNDGGRNPLFKLAGQFMSFSFMAHERLLLRGFSEEKAMAIIGAVISSTIIGLTGLAGEQLAMKLGLMEEEDMKYNINTEEGRLNLGKYMAMRGSFSGLPQTMAEAFANLNENNGGDRFLAQEGGPTVGRVINIGAAAKDFAWEGKVGTRAQVHMIKSSIPFNNMIGLDNMNKHLFNEWYNEKKKRDFDKNEGFRGLGR
jgi:hypothetical protein